MQIAHAAVFGAAQGIGAEIASYLREHGSRLLLLIDKNPRFCGGSVQDPSRGEYLLNADVSSREQLTRVFRDIPPHSLDIVILSAGIKSDDEASMRQVNAEGVKNSFEVVAPRMKKGGLLVLVSSDYFNIAPEDPYAKTKREGALLAQGAAQKHRDDFRVLILLPGPVNTQLFTQDKPLDLIERIESSDGILSTQAFSKMLFEDVIPQSFDKPTGSVAAMYKHTGFAWRTGLGPERS